VAVFCLFLDLLILLVISPAYVAFFKGISSAPWERVFSVETLPLYLLVLLITVAIVLTIIRLFDVIRFLTRFNRGSYLIRWTINFLFTTAIFIIAQFADESSSTLAITRQHLGLFITILGLMAVGFLMRYRAARSQTAG